MAEKMSLPNFALLQLSQQTTSPQSGPRAWISSPGAARRAPHRMALGCACSCRPIGRARSNTTGRSSCIESAAGMARSLAYSRGAC